MNFQAAKEYFIYVLSELYENTNPSSQYSEKLLQLITKIKDLPGNPENGMQDFIFKIQMTDLVASFLLDNFLWFESLPREKKILVEFLFNPELGDEVSIKELAAGTIQLPDHLNTESWAELDVKKELQSYSDCGYSLEWQMMFENEFQNNRRLNSNQFFAQANAQEKKHIVTLSQSEYDYKFSEFTGSDTDVEMCYIEVFDDQRGMVGSSGMACCLTMILVGNNPNPETSELYYGVCHAPSDFIRHYKLLMEEMDQYNIEIVERYFVGGNFSNIPELFEFITYINDKNEKIDDVRLAMQYDSSTESNAVYNTINQVLVTCHGDSIQYFEDTEYDSLFCASKV